ncbi:hypothetical protein [Halalkalibacter lacteus]|uniref:hypothetical protein n=1 Tax=Halalkalibacter lacteus TaxID=3090663 RepID=UPI002FC5A1FB
MNQKFGVTENLFPSLLKIVIAAAFIDTLFSSVFFLTNLPKGFNVFIGSVFVSMFIGSFLLYLLMWIPLALIIEKMIGNHFKAHYSIKSLFIYCLSGSITIVLINSLFYLKNSDFLSLLLDSFITGSLTAIVFYHTMVYFQLTYDKGAKGEFKKVGVSFLLFSLVALAVHTIYSEETDWELHVPTIEYVKSVEEAREMVSFSFKTPSYLPKSTVLKMVTVEEVGNAQTIIGMNYDNEILENEANALYIEVTNNEVIAKLQGDYESKEEISMNDTPAILGRNHVMTENGKLQTSLYLTWVDEGIGYYIYSNMLDEEELLHLAKSFK